MPENKAVINYQNMRDAAHNWGDLLDGLSAAGMEIDPGTSGAELADVLAALILAGDDDAGPDPLVASLAHAYDACDAFGLDEPPVEPGVIHPAGPVRHRWGLQYPGEG
jgi:hypothetical protein